MPSLRRQTPIVVAFTGLGVLAGLTLDLMRPATFRSRIAAAYDEQDAALVGPQVPWRGPAQGRGAALVAASAEARLADPEFLWQVAKAAELTQERPFAGSLMAYLRLHVPLGTHIFRSPEARELPDDSHNKAQLAAWLGERLRPHFDAQTGLLELTATADDPLAAKRLAEAAMEQLTVAELQFEAETAERSRAAADAWLKAHPAAGEARPEASAIVGLGQRAEATPLHTREMELLDRIQVTRSELDQLKSRTAARRATLMTELARLRTRLQPSHPDVIAKRDELRALKKDPGERALRAKLESLQADLAKLRASAPPSLVPSSVEGPAGRATAERGTRDGGAEGGLGQGPGAPAAGIGAAGTLGAPGAGAGTLGAASAGPADATFARALSAWSSQLALEHDRLVKEIDDPTTRTRLRLVVPATYDDRAASAGHLPATPLLGLAGLFLGLGVGFARERRRVPAPAAPTPDELARSLGVPLLGTFPTTAGAAEATAAARRLELALRRQLQGNTVLVQQAVDGEAAPARTLRQLLTVVGTETPLAQLLVDLARDPVVPAAERNGPADFAAFLTGKAPWKEARLARTAERPFDLMALAPGTADTVPLGRLFRQDVLAKLFQGLARTYGRVYVRAPDQALEAAALGQALSDSVLIVDPARADEAALARAVQAADPEKLRGLIVLTG